jgi:septation ring formation regulator EzrA
MNTLILLDVKYIVLLSVGGALVILLAILLYFTVFSHVHLKKQARDLCGKFEREHALLFGQDSQYVHRLEQISSMNLVYAQQYMDWSKRFKDVRDVSDASAQACVNQLKDDLSERKYKELKSYLPVARKAIEDYEEQVDSLSENLKNKFRDEEDCRTLACSQKRNYRKIKQDYYARQSDMALVSQTFETLFSKLDSYLDEAEQDIENARYVDAKGLLQDKIGPVVKQCRPGSSESLPNICILISSVLPDKIASLNSHYEEMIQAGYPLHHIILKGEMENMNQELAILSERVKALSSEWGER